MMIQIRRDGGHVSAMGHRVAEAQGGERELKRRCLETISHYDQPPDEIVFTRFDSLQAGSPVAALAAPRATDPQPAPKSDPAATAARGPGVAKAKERRAR